MWTASKRKSVKIKRAGGGVLCRISRILCPSHQDNNISPSIILCADVFCHQLMVFLSSGEPTPAHSARLAAFQFTKGTSWITSHFIKHCQSQSMLEPELCAVGHWEAAARQPHLDSWGYKVWASWMRLCSSKTPSCCSEPFFFSLHYFFFVVVVVEFCCC